MKNVAKCDTWCELQNPVNHRVFERKLRPKPSGRGHACLGVTQRRPLRLSLLRDSAAREGGYWPPVRALLAAGLKTSPWRRTLGRAVVFIVLVTCPCALDAGKGSLGPRTRRPPDDSLRDPRSGGTTR